MVFKAERGQHILGFRPAQEIAMVIIAVSDPDGNLNQARHGRPTGGLFASPVHRGRARLLRYHSTNDQLPVGVPAPRRRPAARPAESAGATGALAQGNRV